MTPEQQEPKGGYWIAYYSDWSGFLVFDNELECLRYAVERSMMATWSPFGVNPREHIRNSVDRSARLLT
jgi:hypothetical protein